MKKIRPVKKIGGEITLPGDKSISHRAVMIGAIAEGKTTAKNILDCDDCNYTINAFKNMGITIKKEGDDASIEGKGLRGLSKPAGSINVGDSGTTMRLLSGILAGQDFEAVLKGDESLSNRPMNRIVEPLLLMGVDIRSAKDGHPPIKIKGGKVFPINYKMPVSSAQIKSAVIFAGLYSDGVTTVEETFRSRDHTERMLEYFGSDIKTDGLKVAVRGGRELKAKTIEVPGDISSASFFITAAIMLKGSKLYINKVSINPTRAGILNVLDRMGAQVKILNKKNLFEPFADLEVKSGATKGIVIKESEIPGIIDELPILFVLAALSEGRTVIKGVGELKVKETDRIRSMTENLKAMGARIKVAGNDIMIDGVRSLSGASLKSFGDHRTCMAMAIAALAAKSESEIDDIECVHKSFPGFFQTLERMV